MYDDMMTPALKQPFTLLSACMHVIKLELSFQNPDFRILAVQNPEFKILEFY